MNLVKRFFDRRAELKAAEQLRISAGMAKTEMAVKLKLENAIQSMMSKNCPFLWRQHHIPNEKCTGSACVHFYAGHASVEHNGCFPSLPEFWKNYNAPACKLWSK